MRTETLKRTPPNRTETQRPENWNNIPQLHRTNVNARRQNKCWVNKKNRDRKEDYIAISQKPKVKVETEKINKLLLNIQTDNITE